jgi:hypothetical protein
MRLLLVVRNVQRRLLVKLENPACDGPIPP